MKRSAPSTRLTARSVEALLPRGNERREIPDQHCPGLYLVVQPSGAKSWAIRYRANGRPRKYTLGRYHPDALDLLAAREMAREKLRDATAGKDPQKAKVEARRQAAIEAEGVERVRGTDTFAAAWATFDAQHIQPTMRPASQEEWNRVYKTKLKPRWGKLQLQEIAPADVRALKMALRKTPSAADKAVSVVRSFFNWVIREHEAVAVSPCANVTKVDRSKDERVQDTRTLTDDEIRWLWRACDRVGYPFGPLVKLLLLTGARRNEVAHLIDDELNLSLNARVWNLPATRAKNGRAHEFYLADTTLALLQPKALPRIANDSGYLFTTSGKKPVSGFSKMKKALDKAMAEVAVPATIPPWHLHSLRKTFASGLARLGVPLQVAERCLNHKSGTLGGLTAIYNQHEYKEEQRQAFVAWAAHVDSLVR